MPSQWDSFSIERMKQRKTKKAELVKRYMNKGASRYKAESTAERNMARKGW